jgi:hypothetical protein
LNSPPGVLRTCSFAPTHSPHLLLRRGCGSLLRRAPPSAQGSPPAMLIRPPLEERTTRPARSHATCQRSTRSRAPPEEHAKLRFGRRHRSALSRSSPRRPRLPPPPPHRIRWVTERRGAGIRRQGWGIRGGWGREQRLLRRRRRRHGSRLHLRAAPASAMTRAGGRQRATMRTGNVDQQRAVQAPATTQTGNEQLRLPVPSPYGWPDEIHSGCVRAGGAPWDPAPTSSTGSGSLSLPCSSLSFPCSSSSSADEQ